MTDLHTTSNEYISYIEVYFVSKIHSAYDVIRENPNSRPVAVPQFAILSLPPGVDLALG